MQLLESTIEQELERFRTNDVTLSELTLAIQRLQETERTNQAKVRKTNLFLGRLAQQMNLPGMFTLPSGRHFVYMDGERARTKSALPEYMTAREVRPLAQRNLIPNDARTALQDIIRGEPNVQQELPLPREFRYGPDGEMIPADSADAQAQRDAEAAAAAAAPAAAAPAASASEPAASASEPPAPAASATSDAEVDAVIDAARQRSALTRFARSGKGGLRNDRDQVEAIRELQTFLNELGLDTGGTDGRYGGRTDRAVRRFQQAVTGVTVDGDAGPETIGKISEIRTDMARIQELVSAIENSNITDSVIPVRFKSGLAQLLERELTQAERTELQQLVSKYESFRREFPNFQKDLFQQAEFGAQLPNAPGGAPAAQTDAPAQPAAPGTGTAPSATAPGTDARPSTSTPTQPAAPASDNAPPVPGAPEPRSSASVVADPTNTGAVQDPEAATYVQDTPIAARQLKTAMRGFGTNEDTIFRVMSSIRSQQHWDQLQRDYQRINRLDLVTDLEDDLNPTDMDRYVWDPLRRAGVQKGSRINPPAAAPAAAPANNDVRRMDDRTIDLIRNLRP